MSAAPDPDAPQVRDFEMSFAVDGRELTLRGTVPVGDVEPKDLLPVFWSLTDTVVRFRVETVAKLGRPLSCRAGCGACCVQLVPISRTEARHVADVVDGLEPERRAVVLERFRVAKERMRAAGMLDRLLALSAPDNPDTPVAVARDYFRVGVPCPFLEEGSCSIYADRPLRCREYVVVSPAEWCADIGKLVPDAADPVAVIKLPTQPAIGLMNWDGDRAAGEPHHLSLLTALDWVETAGPAPRREGIELLTELLRHTFSSVPDPVRDADLPFALGAAVE